MLSNQIQIKNVSRKKQLFIITSCSILYLVGRKRTAKMATTHGVRHIHKYIRDDSMLDVSGAVHSDPMS